MKIQSRAISLWILAPVLLVLSVMVQGQTAMSIAQARGEASGSAVIVSGRVMSPSGAYNSWSYDQGFLINDGTAGIYVSVSENPGLNVGDRVRVTGTLASSYNLLVLSVPDAASVERISDGPILIPTGGVGEWTEGAMVSVQGTISRPLENDLPYGYKLYVNDGSGELLVFLDATIDAPGIRWLRPGATIRVRGMSGQFDVHYELNPRRRKDLALIAPAP